MKRAYNGLATRRAGNNAKRPGRPPATPPWRPVESVEGSAADEVGREDLGGKIPLQRSMHLRCGALDCALEYFFFSMRRDQGVSRNHKDE